MRYMTYNVRYTMYRVSSKTVYAFVFAISQLPGGLGKESWAFLYCLFSVDLKTIFAMGGEVIPPFCYEHLNYSMMKHDDDPKPLDFS